MSDSARYEATQQAIRRAIAAYTTLIRQASGAGDAERAADLTRKRAACAQALNGLAAADPTEVDAAARTYGQLAQTLRAAAP